MSDYAGKVLADAVVILTTIAAVVWVVTKAQKHPKVSRRDKMDDETAQKQIRLWPTLMGVAKGRGKELEKLKRKAGKK